MRFSSSLTLLCSSISMLSSTIVQATDNVVREGMIHVQNMAPAGGTCQTPVWVAIYTGNFDTYDRGEPISSAMESLAEDGNTGPITTEFANAGQESGAIYDATVGGGPICPGESAYLPFRVELKPGQDYYFSYASMIIPSNDAFIANGNPLAHKIFNSNGNFVDVDFTVPGSAVLDAGSEVNDEVPANTAFFGQMAPNTGVPQNGVVEIHPGFIPNGPILSTEQFENANFKEPDYQTLRFTVVEGDGAGGMPGEDEYGFLVLQIDQNDGPWCAAAVETRNDGNLELRECEFGRKPEEQLWKFDDENRLRSAVGGDNRCMRVGLGYLFERVRVRLGTCDDEYVNFELDDNTGYLKLLENDGPDDFCITNRGGTANVGDTIHALSCPTRNLDDFVWEFQSM